MLRKRAGFASRLTKDLPAGATEIEVKDASGFRVGDEIGIRDPHRNGWHCHHPIVKAVRGKRVTFHALCPRNTRTDCADISIGLAIHALPGYGFDEFSNAQAATVSCGAFRRQDMVGARCLVAVGYRGFLS